MKPGKAKLAIVMAAIVIVAAALAYKFWNGRESSAIRFSGNVELTQVDVAFKTAGRLVERPVDEGQAVKRGVLLARLDTEQLQRQHQRDSAAIQAAEWQVRQMVTAAEYQQRTAEADRQLRQAELAQAEARLRDLLAGARKQEIEQAQAGVDEAAAEEQRASRDWQRAEALFKNDDISASQHDQFRTRYQAAVATLRQARERLELLKEGARPQEVEGARAQVDRARAAVKLAEAASLEVTRRRQEIETRRADLERARAQLSIVNSQIDDSTVVSPLDGVVLSKAAEPGQVVAAGTTVLTVGDIEHPWVRGYIGERDLGRVKIGSRVRVTTDSFPGKVYWGRLSFLSSEAEFTPKQIQTPEERVKLVYRIKVELPNPNRELKSSMPVDAEIVPE